MNQISLVLKCMGVYSSELCPKYKLKATWFLCLTNSGGALSDVDTREFHAATFAHASNFVIVLPPPEAYI